MDHRRRSLDEAITTTPDEDAFLNTGKAIPDTPVPEAAKPLGNSTEDHNQSPNPFDLPQTFQSTYKPRGRRVLTVQIEQHILDELFRVSIERKLQQIEPHTQRDLVSEALQDWLKANRFLAKFKASEL